MRSRVYETVKRPSGHLSVRPSVCSIDRQQQRRAAGLLLSAPRQEIDGLHDDAVCIACEGGSHCKSGCTAAVRPLVKLLLDIRY